jgi:hypothetical protein
VRSSILGKIHLLIASAVKEEDDSTEDAVEDGEDEEEAEVLLVLGQRPEHEGDEAEAEPDDQRALHVLGRRPLNGILVYAKTFELV